MASDDISTTIVSLSKRPISRKHRIYSHNQSTGKNFADDFRQNRTLTATNRPSSKLPTLLEKTSIYPSTPNTTQFRRYRSQQKDLTSATSKLEQLSTNSPYQTRLPTFYTLTSDNEEKRASEFRRRQIYALNHFMRQLEQEQFRQLCKLQSTGTNNHENTVNNNEDTNKELLR